MIRLYFVFWSFKNKPYMTFDDIGQACEQEIELIQDPSGVIAYPLRLKKRTYKNL